MRKHSSMSWKRTWIWSISSLIGALDLGPLTAEEKETSEKTTTTYKDARGKQRFKGNSNLKKSQHLSRNHCVSVCFHMFSQQYKTGRHIVAFVLLWFSKGFS